MARNNPFSVVDRALRDSAASVGSLAGRAIGNVVAPIIGGQVGAAIGGFLGKGAYRLAQAIGSFVVAEAIAGFVFTIVAAAILVIFATFAMFIINSGAYVVPPREGTFVVGTPTEFSEGCFQFSGPWPDDTVENMREAASIIMSVQPYSTNLCASGPINVIYTDTGECFNGVCYGGRRVGPRTILIFKPGTGSVGNSLYTLAHESGHVFQDTTNADFGLLQDPGVISELPLFGTSGAMTGICTYPLDYNDDAPGKQVPFTENFAEGIALFIAGPNPESGYRDLTCLGGTFQNSLDNTWLYFRNNVFFNDGPW